MSPIEAAARSDAEFDGRTFEAMGRADRDRYLARSAKAITAFIEAAAEDEGVRLKVECAMSGRHWSESARLGILALKEAINGP